MRRLYRLQVGALHTVLGPSLAAKIRSKLYYTLLMLRNTTGSWGSISKTLHWVMALLIFSQIVLGWVAVRWPLSPTKLNLFVWHKSTGILILALAVLRIGWRLTNVVPALPTSIPSWERMGAHASHLSLYFLMLALPLSGWIINSASNFPLKVFWLFPLPDVVPPSKPFQNLAEIVHLVLFSLFAAVLVVHIAAALRHQFIRRNNLLKRMLPFGSRT
jgi:cytochrome b561